MSIFRKPKGTYTRALPDWFSDRAMYGGAVHYEAGIPAHFKAVELYNNSALGQKLFVYGLFFADGTGDFSWASLLKGPVLPDVDIGPFPVDATALKGPGQIRSDTLNDTVQTGQVPLTNFDSDFQQGLAYPIFIIPATYSLVISSQGFTSHMTAAFFYTYMDN